MFDGHGGSFCSSYLAANIPSFFAQESSSLAIDTDNATSETLTALLTNVCVSADRELSLQPRMAVERSEAGKISCMDSSGSTAVMVLVTDGLLAVSNVGDSRAVLAQRRAQPSNSRERTASGLSSCESSLPSSPSHVNRKQFFGGSGSGGNGAASPSPEAFKSSYATSSRDGQESESPQVVCFTLLQLYDFDYKCAALNSRWIARVLPSPPPQPHTTWMAATAEWTT